MVGNKKIMSRMLTMPNQLVECERCGKKMPAYYIRSPYDIKGLWVSCKRCGLHARSFIPGLPIPILPSKAYLKIHPPTQSDGREQRQGG